MWSWSVWQVWRHVGLFCALCPGFEMVKCGSYPGLQLCDNNVSSSYGAAQCQGYSGGCQGSSSNSCWANHMWSGFQPGVSTAQVYILNNGSLIANGCGNNGICSILDSFTVRCVLDLEYKTSADYWFAAVRQVREL